MNITQQEIDLAAAGIEQPYLHNGVEYIEKKTAEGITVLALSRKPGKLVFIDFDLPAHFPNLRLSQVQANETDLGFGVRVKESYITTSTGGNQHYYVILTHEVTPEHASAIAAYLGSDPYHESLSLKEYFENSNHPWVFGERQQEVPGLLAFLQQHVSPFEYTVFTGRK